MAYHEHSQVILEELEPRDYFETFAIAIPVAGSAPIITHSGDEAYNTVLEIISTNKYLSDQAIDISKRSAEVIGTLRGLAHVLQRKENRCEETQIHIHNIARLVAIAERDDLKESIEDMTRLEKLRKAINDCINAGHKKLENLALL